MFVDFVGNDGQIMFLGNVQDGFQVALAKHASARVARVGHDQGGRVGINQRFQLYQVYFPVPVRHQVIVTALDSEALGQGTIDGETRPGDQYVLARPG